MTWCVPCGYDTKNLPNGNCSSCGKENDYSTSLKEAVEKYRAEGLSVIPNKPQTKKPAFGEGEYKPYYQKYCDVDPAPDGNVGIMTGIPSCGIIVFDDDHSVLVAQYYSTSVVAAQRYHSVCHGIYSIYTAC